MDSIYVVAFYAGEIPVLSGPESFSCLPGMILGVALPYENVSWFATKVDLSSAEIISTPNKVKPVTFKTLLDSLTIIIKNGHQKIKALML